jgi:GTP-binding protein EngB required for normal cell division
MIENGNNSANEQIRKDITQIQDELQDALATLMNEVGSKLKAGERAEIEHEVKELNELLERLKSGLVWISLFGKTTVGKSALANSIIEQDIAGVDIRYDHTIECKGYERKPWMIVDVPGFMGKSHLESMAIEEAKKAHGHIFVVDGQPYADEIELFDKVHTACPNVPKLVFCNKADLFDHMPKRDKELVISIVKEKMNKYVQSPEDILFGSAALLDRENDVMVRQQVPHLIDRLYDGAGTLGMIVNVLDPAGRAADISTQMREKISQIRIKIGRRVAAIFGAMEVGAAAIPLSTLITTPGLLSSLAYIEMKIMGKTITKDDAAKIAGEGLKTCGTVLVGDFAAVAGASIVLDAANLLGPIGTLVGVIGNVAGLGWWRYRRTVIFGEVMLEFAKRDFSWGGEDKHKVIQDCKQRAIEYHMKFKKNRDL